MDILSDDLVIHSGQRSKLIADKKIKFHQRYSFKKGLKATIVLIQREIISMSAYFKKLSKNKQPYVNDKMSDSIFMSNRWS